MIRAMRGAFIAIVAAVAVAGGSGCGHTGLGGLWSPEAGERALDGVVRDCAANALKTCPLNADWPTCTAIAAIPCSLAYGGGLLVLLLDGLKPGAPAEAPAQGEAFLDPEAAEACIHTIDLDAETARCAADGRPPEACALERLEACLRGATLPRALPPAP